jgi:hypothetical protein
MRASAADVVNGRALRGAERRIGTRQYRRVGPVPRRASRPVLFSGGPTGVSLDRRRKGIVIRDVAGTSGSRPLAQGMDARSLRSAANVA